MSENKDIKTALPKLRFPEFVNDAPWRDSSIKDVLNYERPEPYIVSNTKYESDGIPVLTANKSFVLGYTNEESGIYNSFPVIIFDDFTIDRKYVDFPFKIKSSAIKILKSKGDNNIRFINELMGTVKFEATEHKRYYISTYQNMSIYIPCTKEQAKIAECLSSLDDAVSAVSDKIEALKEHKKGLMQQLFPAEGKTTPAFRFPEFKNSSEWNETTLGLICEYTNGSSLEKMVVESGSYYLISLNSIDIEGNLKSEMKRVENTDFSLQMDDIVMVLSDVAYGYFLGLTAIIPNDNYVLNQRMARLRLRNHIKDNFDVNFIRYYINSKQMYFKNNGQGSSQLNLSKSAVVEFPIYVPANTIEQQKITGTLKSIDNLIKASSDKLTQFKAYKKGLMQQLFPNLNE